MKSGKLALPGLLGFLAWFGLAASSPAATTNLVRAGNFFFNPTNLTINVGDSIRWTNTSSTQHDVTQGTRTGGATPSPYWAAGNLAAFNGQFLVTFSNAGFYPYICARHVLGPSPTGPQQTGSVTVVSANLAPTVTLTTPTNLAVFAAPATLALAATVADLDGTVTNVQFFAGNTLLTSDATAPFAATASNLAAGSHALTARAFDNGGASGTSAPVNITVVVATPIELRSPTAQPNAFQFQFTANPGLTYVIEGSATSTAPAPFMPLATNVANAAVMTFTDPMVNGRSNRAYRIFRSP